MALSETFSSNWWSSTLQCWWIETSNIRSVKSSNEKLGELYRGNKEVPGAAWGLSVLPLLSDTAQNHSPWTTACLEIKATPLDDREQTQVHRSCDSSKRVPALKHKISDFDIGTNWAVGQCYISECESSWTHDLVPVLSFFLEMEQDFTFPHLENVCNKWRKRCQMLCYDLTFNQA